jgi:hypothetical protein
VGYDDHGDGTAGEVLHRGEYLAGEFGVEVGSSKSMSLGRMASARAMATRCCCPPESWLG